MIVTQIEHLGKGRIRIFLEGKEELVVYKKEVSHLKLEEGSSLSEQQYQDILHGILVPRARKRAMHLLEKMDRTEMQLREKLKQSGYPQAATDQAVAYVKEFHYIDDFRYACHYIHSQKEQKGRNRLFLELLQKGIKKEYIQQALEEEYEEEGESARIRKWLEKKGYCPQQAEGKEKQRMYQFLLRRGFGAGDILKEL